MTQSPTGSPSVAAEQELARVLEEWTAKAQAGEPFDIEGCAQAHPEYASELRRLLPALALLANLSRSGPKAVEGLVGIEQEDPAARTLGDFRILREVGRGGMGVVYEAEQISLGRRVALKVLPFAATMDPRQLQRFRNEARAAACLHHEHIVPVYSVGCERGVHYYAMQLIDGVSLAQMMSSRRAPMGAAADAPTAPVAALTTEPGQPRKREFYRAAARLVAAAADALEYAHGMGVVHRDVKPGNLIVDETGKVWVADFGLARFGADANLTVSGDLLGTLRYMSPEQALARHDLVDHRTDVYSLGATLYELLTLRPAVDGADKQEVLRKIAFEEPTRPRKLDRSIPAELETVTLKALAKDSAERYATAAELADDLRRWLNDQAITAKPPTLWQVIVKCVARHQLLVGAAAVTCLLAAVGLAVSTFLIWEARQEAERRRQEADERYQYAREIVDRMYSGVGNGWLTNEPHLMDKRRELLQYALEFYKRFAADQGNDAKALRGLGLAHGRLGDTLLDLREYATAEQELRKALALFQQLARDEPNEMLPGHLVAKTYYKIGRVMAEQGRLAEAEVAHRDALAVRENLVRAFPSDPGRIGDVVGSLSMVGRILRQTRQYPEAEGLFRRGLTFPDRRLGTGSDDIWLIRNHAFCQQELGLVCGETGRADEAERLLSRCLKYREELVALNPKDCIYGEELADAHSDFAEMWFRNARWPEARERYDHACAVWRSLTATYPRVPDYRARLARARQGVAHAFAGEGQMASADSAFTDALSIWRPLLKDLPSDPHYLRMFGEQLHQWALVLKDRGELVKAVEHLEEAVTLQTRASDRQPENLVSRRLLRDHYAALEDVHRRRGDHEAAGRAAAKASVGADGKYRTAR